MPTGDGTGPAAMGPRTGRGVGYCGGYDAPSWANWGPGRRSYGPRGRGMRGGRWGGYGAGSGGGGRGWRHRYYASGLPRWARGPKSSGCDVPPAWAHGPAYDAPYKYPSREQEIGMLKDEAVWLKEQLDAINERLDELSQE